MTTADDALINDPPPDADLGYWKAAAQNQYLRAETIKSLLEADAVFSWCHVRDLTVDSVAGVRLLNEWAKPNGTVASTHKMDDPYAPSSWVFGKFLG